MPRTRLCAIWCGRARRPRKISFATATDWGSFCCATASVPPMRERRGARSIWSGSRIPRASSSLRGLAPLEHYLHEVEHAAERIVKLEQAIDEAVAQAAPEIRAVIEALQALRGVAQTTAATVVGELGTL